MGLGFSELALGFRVLGLRHRARSHYWGPCIGYKMDKEVENEMETRSISGSLLLIAGEIVKALCNNITVLLQLLRHGGQYSGNHCLQHLVLCLFKSFIGVGLAWQHS